MDYQHPLQEYAKYDSPIIFADSRLVNVGGTMHSNIRPMIPDVIYKERRGGI